MSGLLHRRIFWVGSCVAVLLLLLALDGCGADVFAITGESRSSKSITLTPGVILAGTSTTFILTGSAFDKTTSVTIDGTPVAASLVSSSELHFDQSASAGRHSVAILRNGVAALPAETVTLLVTSGYTGYGDSITQGVILPSPSTQGYVALLAASRQLPLHNEGLSGDQACDIFPRQIAHALAGFTPSVLPISSLMIGTNDLNRHGTDANIAIFNLCHQAAIAWLGTDRSDKLLPGDTRLSVTGGCVNSASSLSLVCGSAGAVSATLNTVGNAIYLWYVLQDSAPATAQFSVTVDDKSAGLYSALPALPIATLNSTSASAGLIRIPAAAGSHAVIITTNSGGVGIFGMGSNTGGSGRPLVLVGDLPNQLLSNPVASVSGQLAYVAAIRANISLLANDGLDIRPVADRNYMLGTSAEMFDQLHPNVLGNQHLYAAFRTALDLQ